MLFAWAYVPRIARAEGRDPRFLTIVLRGALDGLAAVAPVGDPDWIKLRGDNALRLDGETPALPLDGFFALNPAMPNLHRLYQAGQATIVHAAATPYRERSHFDGQDVLESGLAGVGRTDTGWLNRALVAHRAGRPRRCAGAADLRGRPDHAAGGARTRAGAVLDAAAAAAGERRDHHAAARSLSPHRSDARPRAGGPHRPRRDRAGRRHGAQRIEGPVVQTGGIAQVRAYFAEAAGAAASSWRAPTARASARSRSTAGTPMSTRARSTAGSPALLGALDGAIAAIETNMGEAWRETVVALVTEFGRTARVNGNDGTDHGTATVALLAGGALKGGRVIADWPGLKEADLHEKRDLKPTTDLRAVLKGLLKDHLRLDDAVLAAARVPGQQRGEADGGAGGVGRRSGHHGRQ